jgi:anhydro-N-acetylmuramic acid kinase
MVIDALVRHYTQGRKAYDRNAEMAGRGSFLPRLSDELMRDNYYVKPPPKSAGREQYGKAYVRRVLAHRDARRAKPEDVVRTVTGVTANSILYAFSLFIFPRANVKELVVSGGGAHNPLLMQALDAAFEGDFRIRESSELGVPGDAKEAFAFAVLACETLHKRPANVPGATGAKKAVVLGKVCYAG